MQPCLFNLLRNLARLGTMGRMTTQQQGDAVPEWTVGDRLRKARESRGFDQAEFAAETGISRGTIGNYELGKTGAYKPVYMRAWAMATGVSLKWLETGVGSGAPTPPTGVRQGELAALTERKRSRARHAAGDTHQYLGALARAS